MLKLIMQRLHEKDLAPAAFRRLCVETAVMALAWVISGPAAFRRLCVETALLASIVRTAASRLQAAVC